MFSIRSRRTAVAASPGTRAAVIAAAMLLLIATELRAAPGSVPTIHEDQKLSAPTTAAQAHFGAAVAVDGDTAVIGSPLANAGATKSGRIDIFVRRAGQWVHDTTLVSAVPVRDGYFGRAVAISGDVIAVGEPGVRSYPAAVTIFSRTPAGWTQAARLTAAAGSGLGWSVAMEGDRILAGAPGSRFVTVIERRRGTWMRVHDLTASTGTRGDGFGNSVALSGTTAVIGADEADSGTQSGTGAAWVFTYDGRADVWTERAMFQPGELTTGDDFGASVAIGSDGTIAVGAPRFSGGWGAVYIFGRTGPITWSQTDRLDGTYGSAGFGTAVGMNATGNVLVVGSIAAPVQLIETASAGWVDRATLEPVQGFNFGDFGTAVAYGNRRILAGSRLDDALGKNAGAVFDFPDALTSEVEEENSGGSSSVSGGCTSAPGRPGTRVGAIALTTAILIAFAAVQRRFPAVRFTRRTAHATL
jgi:hypothetical protein